MCGDNASFTAARLGGRLPFEIAELQLAAGSRLALYTGGLVEDRDRDLDVGLELLRTALCGPDRTPEQTCQAVFDALLPEHPSDDIALLIVRTRTLEPDQTAFTTELIISELVTYAIRYDAHDGAAAPCGARAAAWPAPITPYP